MPSGVRIATLFLGRSLPNFEVYVRYLLALLFSLVLVQPVTAQVNPVLAGQPFNVQFDHSGQNVTGFQCYVDGKPTGAVLAVSARVCQVPGQAPGGHTVAVEAINVFGKAKSPDLSVTAGTPPDAPMNLQITMTVAVKPDGTAELLAFHVQKQ